jgi:hypothetical protein
VSTERPDAETPPVAAAPVPEVAGTDPAPPVPEVGVAERTARRRWAWVPAAVGLPVLLLLGLFPVRHGVEDDLADRATSALAAAGYGDLAVSVRGRDAHVRGAVDSEEDRDAVHHLVRSREGIRHVFDGGLVVRAAADLVGVEAHATDGRLTLVGRVPSEAARAAMVASVAATVTAERVDDRLVVDTGAAALDVDSATRFGALAGRLAVSGDGIAARAGGGVVVTGTVRQDVDRTAIVAMADGLDPSPRVEITVG